MQQQKQKNSTLLIEFYNSISVISQQYMFEHKKNFNNNREKFNITGSL